MTPIAFFLSASLLSLEISLMRMLSYASWHHFMQLTISVVLLAFAGSGSLLAAAERIVRRSPQRFLRGLTSLFALSILPAFVLASFVPLEARFLPAILWSQAGSWLAFWAIISVPFFFGAGALCLTLMAADGREHRVYGANLLGGTFGVVVSILTASFLPPEKAAIAGNVLALCAVAVGGRPWVASTIGTLGAGVCALAAFWFAAPAFYVDSLKPISHAWRLAAEGAAQKIAHAPGLRGMWEAYSGESFHEVFAPGMTAKTPSITALFRDGYRAGSLLQLEDREAEELFKGSLQEIPYRLSGSGGRVLLLDEIDGGNLWLAHSHESRSIPPSVTVVQRDPVLRRLLRGELSARGGTVFELPSVEYALSDSRHFLSSSDEQFEIIQLAGFQGLPAGSGGIRGLAEDYLLTREGMGAAIQRLADNGLLFGCRGLQNPPRDELKMLALLTNTLRDQGVAEPREHIAIYRDFLALCVVASKAPLGAEKVAVLRALLEESGATPVWFPGIKEDELNTPDEIPPPPGCRGDIYYCVSQILFSPETDDFIRGWLFDIRPPTDDRPFFSDFFRFKSFQELRAAFGELWPVHAELAFVFLLVSTGVAAIVGAIIILAPLRFISRAAEPPAPAQYLSASFYFALIGLGFMLFEMFTISRLVLVLGDPVLASALGIGAFLFWSGIGSITSGERFAGVSNRTVILFLFAAAALQYWLLPRIVPAGAVSLWLSGALALAALAPLPFFLGFFLPRGISRLSRNPRTAPLIPWAWGINGLASVLAPPLAALIAMGAGYQLCFLVAAICYGMLWRVK